MRTPSVAIRSVAISRSPRKASIIAACAGLLCLLLTGCSALRIGYSTAPDLTYWWFDRYIEVSDAQAPRVREAIHQWFVWNRRVQLPDFAALLTRAQADVRSDTTPARIRAWGDELRLRWRPAFERIAPQAAELMLTVTPQQIAHLEQRYAKSDDEFRDDFLQADSGKRRQATLKRTVERAEQIYGDLSDAQVAMVTELLLRSPFDPDVWLAERQRRQQAMVQMLRRLREPSATKEQALVALRTWTEQVERSPRAEYRRYLETLDDFNFAFAARLHNSTSPAQRRHAADTLGGWAEDLRAIAAAPESKNRSLEMQ